MAYNKEASRKYNASPKGKARKSIYYKRWRLLPKSLATYKKRTEWKRWALSILKLNMGGCVDCGYNTHAAALDFDHKPGLDKTKDVSRTCLDGWTSILYEISKCELVCANCHRIRTFTRKRNGT